MALLLVTAACLHALVVMEAFGCESGWTRHGASCYKFIDKKKTYTEAEATCHGLKSQLPHFSTAEEWNTMFWWFEKNTWVGYKWSGSTYKSIDGKGPGNIGISRIKNERKGRGKREIEEINIEKRRKKSKKSKEKKKKEKKKEKQRQKSNNNDCIRTTNKENKWKAMKCHDKAKFYCQKEAKSAVSRTRKKGTGFSNSGKWYTATSGTSRPGTATSGTSRPGTATSGTSKPGTATSRTSKPGTATSGTSKPGTATSRTSKPGTATSGTSQPGTATGDDCWMCCEWAEQEQCEINTVYMHTYCNHSCNNRG